MSLLVIATPIIKAKLAIPATNNPIFQENLPDGFHEFGTFPNGLNPEDDLKKKRKILIFKYQNCSFEFSYSLSNNALFDETETRSSDCAVGSIFELKLNQN